VEDLKKQASELYRERTEKEGLPTSDSLSMSKVFFISIAIVIVCLVVIQSFGGFKRSRSPVEQAAQPPAPIKLEPLPDASSSTQPEYRAQVADESKPPSTVSPPAPPASKPEPAPREIRPTQETRPNLERETSPARTARPNLIRETPSAAKSAPTKAAGPAAAESAPSPSEQVSPEERARRQTAHDIVLEKSPALANLLVLQSNRDWKAVPEGPDTYQVTFTLTDDSTGSPAQYIWRVSLSTRSVTPLSYYARRLPN